MVVSMSVSMRLSLSESTSVGMFTCVYAEVSCFQIVPQSKARHCLVPYITPIAVLALPTAVSACVNACVCMQSLPMSLNLNVVLGSFCQKLPLVAPAQSTAVMRACACACAFAYTRVRACACA